MAVNKKPSHFGSGVSNCGLTEEIPKAEVLASGPLLVVNLGHHEVIIPAKRISNCVVFVGIGALAIQEDYKETGGEEVEGAVRE